MTIEKTESRAGFQGSTITGCDVVVYSHNDDPILTKKQPGAWQFRGKNERAADPMVVSMTSDKLLGDAAGSFTVDVKARPDFFDQLVDDDWIDIIGTVGGRRFHILRGTLDSFRETTATNEGGAPMRTVSLVGRDFGAVFDKTLIWFNRFRAENAGFSQTIDMFKALNVVGEPNIAVRRLLFGFLETLAAADPPRANWTLPSSMANAAATFPDTVLFDDTGFSGDPARVAVAQSLMDPDGQGVFSLAQEWSDPQFCELYCDLVGADTLPMSPGREYDEASTRMAVIYRDRPFPTMRNGRHSLWFSLPMATVIPQEVASMNIGRGGGERYNAFFASPQAIQNLAAINIDMHGPLWDTKAIERHGMKPFHVDSRYIANEASLYTMSEVQRTTAMNLHCLNPYLLNGTLSLTRFRPDIRVGTRIQIPGERPEDRLVFYVEQVSHTWRFPDGKTTLGVTRGWRGTDASYLAALAKVSDRYTLLPGNDKAARPFSSLRLSSEQEPPA